MEHMFNNCNSLVSLPDISKWDTSNVKNMKRMYNNCNSLMNLPDTSNFNTSEESNNNCNIF